MMKILTNALLFNLFASYLEGMVQVAEELPAAYDNFVTLLGELPQNENQILKLRRLNYTKIELASILISLKISYFISFSTSSAVRTSALST